MPHSNLLELAVRDFNNIYSSAELISIASNKKKGFILTCGARLEDVVKAIHACPSSFFILTTSKNSIITFEDALKAIYGPMKKI